MDKRKIEKNIQKIPKNFVNFADCVSWVKKSTYLIVRWCPAKWWIQRETLWTGVIVWNWRLITCAHVIKWWKWHKNWLLYYFVRHDDLDNWHTSIFNLNDGKNLFIYDKFDLAVIYLEKDFYEDWDKIFKPQNEYVRINKTPQLIWTDIGILWYPHSKLTFINWNLQLPQIWNVVIRADKWVINSKFKTPDWVIRNEFTIQFNPGNSWWPIFSAKNWTLIWLVEWYRNIETNAKPLFIEEALPNWAKIKTKTFNIHSSYYSMWIPVENYLDILKEHDII
jgi:hypothetical protein